MIIGNLSISSNHVSAIHSYFKYFICWVSLVEKEFELTRKESIRLSFSIILSFEIIDNLIYLKSNRLHKPNAWPSFIIPSRSMMGINPQSVKVFE
jgi:hypothetical protein